MLNIEAEFKRVMALLSHTLGHSVRNEPPKMFCESTSKIYLKN